MICTDTVELNGLARYLYGATTASNDPYCLLEGGDMNNGYNPIRWDCLDQGCYMHKCHPRIEIFADCFPEKIAMSDIDGVVEISGYFLFMEWKGRGGKLTEGQKMLIERLTALSPKVVFYLVYGDSQTMEVTKFQRYYKDKVVDYEAGLDELENQFKDWVDYVYEKTGRNRL